MIDIMKESLSKNIYLNSINTELERNKRQKSLNKDLFSVKLGNTFFSKPALDKARLPPIRKTIFNDNRRNKMNKFPSFEQTNEIVNIIKGLNIPLRKRREKSWYTDVNYLNENNKVMTKTQNIMINDFTNAKYFKKEIKKILKTRINSQEKKYEKLINRENDSYHLKTLDNSKNKNIFGGMTKFNNHKIRIQPISIKELLKNRTIINNNFNITNDEEFRKLRFKRNKIQNRSNDVLGNPTALFNIEQKIIKNHQNQNKEDKNSIIFLTNFFEDFIELYSLYDSKPNYVNLIDNFNRTYFFLFEINSFPRTQMNKLFLQTYKYTCILDICLVFISKDEELYNIDTTKVKEFLRNFIFLCLNTINYKKLESKKVNDFMNEIKNLNLNEDKKTFIDILDSILILLFNGKINDYKKIRKCSKQLLNNINNDTPEKILKIINESILFCQNCSYYYDDEDDYNKKKKKKKKNKSGETETQSLNSNLIEAPFIKKKTDKKFSLVIDLDETLIHNLNLPFGHYFLVRPGVFELFEKINKIYEIVIFTASTKRYAYSIINKIDSKNNVEYVLHKKYIAYEDGKPVKKLDMIGRDINKIIFVDNLEINAKYNKKNLYLISSWYNNVYDDEIYKLQEKLIKIANSENYKNDITKGLIEN